MSNMLSPEAKEFVPRQLGAGASDSGGSGGIQGQVLGSSPSSAPPEGSSCQGQPGQPVNGLPSYMTTCYPFVASADPRLAGGPRPRGRGGKFTQQQLFMQFQQGAFPDRLPHPAGKNFVNSGTNWEPASNMSDVYSSFGSLPNGMPFDGGTYQNGFVHSGGVSQMAGGDSKAAGLDSGRPFNAQFPGSRGDQGFTDSSPPTAAAHLVNGYGEGASPVTEPGGTGSAGTGKKRRRHKKNKSTDEDGNNNSSKSNSAVQTDLPASIADSTLDHLPNSLYKSSASYTTSDLSSGGHDLHLYNSTFHHNNQGQGQNHSQGQHGIGVLSHTRNTSTDPALGYHSGVGTEFATTTSSSMMNVDIDETSKTSNFPENHHHYSNNADQHHPHHYSNENVLSPNSRLFGAFPTLSGSRARSNHENSKLNMENSRSNHDNSRSNMDNASHGVNHSSSGRDSFTQQSTTVPYGVGNNNNNTNSLNSSSSIGGVGSTGSTIRDGDTSIVPAIPVRRSYASIAQSGPATPVHSGATTPGLSGGVTPASQQSNSSLKLARKVAGQSTRQTASNSQSSCDIKNRDNNNVRNRDKNRDSNRDNLSDGSKTAVASRRNAPNKLYGNENINVADIMEDLERADALSASAAAASSKSASMRTGSAAGAGATSKTASVSVTAGMTSKPSKLSYSSVLQDSSNKRSRSRSAGRSGSRSNSGHRSDKNRTNNNSSESVSIATGTTTHNIGYNHSVLQHGSAQGQGQAAQQFKGQFQGQSQFQGQTIGSQGHGTDLTATKSIPHKGQSQGQGQDSIKVQGQSAVKVNSSEVITLSDIQAVVGQNKYSNVVQGHHQQQSGNSYSTVDLNSSSIQSGGGVLAATGGGSSNKSVGVDRPTSSNSYNSNSYNNSNSNRLTHQSGDFVGNYSSDNSYSNVNNSNSNSYSIHNPSSNPSKGQGSEVKVIQSAGITNDLHDLLVKSQGHSDNNNNEGEMKKKKRRRRRRKRKSGDGGENDDGNYSGNNEEITLHFEDDEEFPDLATVVGGDDGNYSSRSTTPANISYSEILKNNTQVQSNLSSQEESSAVTSGGKESRSSRKRRKRREVANKAADAEMAEIGLEQHMLELKMKQKLPLAAKKSVSPQRTSVSPVRNTPSQGVWKLTPASPTSQPSSTGKKVSLLLPGTVATEPAPHTVTTHSPNTAVKQPGILKTSQPTTPAANNTPVNTATNNTSSNTTSTNPTSTPSTATNTSTGSGSGAASASVGAGKKSKQPITYNLGAMIDALELKKEQPAAKKEVRPVVIKKDDIKPHNILDSSAPTIKRGKERETPKNKKPSPLKKVILKEREEKKRLRMLDEDDVGSGAPVGIGVVSGGESDLSQDATSYRGSMEVGLGTPASAELSPISQPSPSCISPMSPGASPLSSGVNSPVTGTIQQTVKLKIHSRRFREYCNQVLDKEIDNHVTALLQDLVRFQDKQYHKDPVKAKSKRRFVLGLREVTKHLKLRKVKCVVISPNLEKIQSKGGLDDALNNILELCNDQKVPFIFALGRRALGRACAKLVPVSVVGVFNYEGSEENFRSLVQLTEKAREQYREMIVQIEKEMAEHPPRVSVPGVPHIFAHMGHSRTPSGCSVISFTSSILSEPISENYPHSEPETDNRGYEIEKDDDGAGTGGDDSHRHGGVGDVGIGRDNEDDFDDEDDDVCVNDAAYEADDELVFGENRKKKRNKERTRAGSGGLGGDSEFLESTITGDEHYYDDDETTMASSHISIVTGVDNVPRRPGILKNSAERLRNQELGLVASSSSGYNSTPSSMTSLAASISATGRIAASGIGADSVSKSDSLSSHRQQMLTSQNQHNRSGGDLHHKTNSPNSYPSNTNNSSKSISDRNMNSSELNADFGDENGGNLGQGQRMANYGKGLKGKFNENVKVSVTGDFNANLNSNHVLSKYDDNDGDFDHGEELDFVNCDDEGDSGSEGEFDDGEMARKEGEDTIGELPHYIDSVHHFDLSEILSQNSTKTVENADEVQSTHSSKTTHSSRTLGEGSALAGERDRDRERSVPGSDARSGAGENAQKSNPRSATPNATNMLEMKNLENINTALVLKGKGKVDKETRTLSWVKETQSLHFSEQIGAEDGGKVGVVEDFEDTVADVPKNMKLECCDTLA